MISITKNYGITISMQKISSIHKFNLKIQQILGSHKLKSYAYQKIIIKGTFSFPEFLASCKKSVYSLCSFLRYSQLYTPMTKLTITIFDDVHQQTFNSKFCESVLTYKKSDYFISFFWRYSI